MPLMTPSTANRVPMGAALMTAALPPLLGYDWFTAYFERRTLPPWLQKLPVTRRISRVIGTFWIAIFLVAAALCAHAPSDWRFTFLYPNVLIFGVGLAGNRLLPMLYLKLFAAEPPTTAEAVIMGMPFVFNRRAAAGVRTEIQFRVSGGEPGDYWVRIAGGRCESFTGDAPTAAVTIYTPDTVWLRIVRGELDGTQAFFQGLFHVTGNIATL